MLPRLPFFACPDAGRELFVLWNDVAPLVAGRAGVTSPRHPREQNPESPAMQPVTEIKTIASPAAMNRGVRSATPRRSVVALLVIAAVVNSSGAAMLLPREQGAVSGDRRPYGPPSLVNAGRFRLERHDAATGGQPAVEASATEVPAAEAAPDALPGPDDVPALAREAYVWGWPLAYVHTCRRQLEKVPAPGNSGGMPVAPVNRLAMLVDRISPRAAAIPCPNQDVMYGFGIFDLAESAVVLQVPDFGDRFWLYQLGDQRTDAFANLGSMYGTQPGFYLVVGPGWQGAAPEGFEGVLRCPTRHAFCIPRVFVSAREGDREAAAASVRGIAAYPLHEFTRETLVRDWSRLRWFPNLGRAGHRRGVSPEAFFDSLPEILADVPPLPGEEPLYARLRWLATAIAGDDGLRNVAIESAAKADREVLGPLFEFRNVGRPLPGHWTTLVNGAAFGTDYLTRTAVAKSNVFVNRHHETKYYYQDLDAEGRRLDGGREYRITFPAGRLPPARGFWSLTVYDERHGLPQGLRGRQSIGSRDTDLEFGPDGSLTVVVSPAAAADSAGDGTDEPIVDDGAGNRLSAPRGGFSLYLRIYWPEDTALDGSWVPPAVHARPYEVARVTSQFP
jgi:hypothetical protein